MVDRMKALEYLAGMLERTGRTARDRNRRLTACQFLQSMNPGGEDGGE